MAEIRKVVRGNPLSTFTQGTPSSGGAFRLLAGMAEDAYKWLEPAAVKEMEAYGQGAGSAIAKQQIGDPAAAVTSSGMGESGVSASLSKTESGGNYQAQNSEGFVGKYQWGQGRLNDYNKANGTNYTMAEFKATPQVQEAAQKWHEGDILKSLGKYAGKVVNGILMTPGAIIAAAHLGGIGGARKFIESNGAYDPADSNGTHLSDYAKTHGGADVSVSTSGGAYTPPTMLRDADGKLTARLFSPLSGPLLQVANAAAGVAYTSDVMLKGQVDLMNMSQEFALNPEGFQQAATSYVNDLVKAAPDMLKADIRASLDTEFKRRFLGMVDEKQRDTFQRAGNSNGALVDRYEGDLAQAVAGGNPEDIKAAEDNLQATLRVRETLPGLSWTPEQSQNRVAAAREKGQAEIQKRQTEQKGVYKDQLKTAEDAALVGRTSEFDSLLDNPLVKQLLPQEWLEAAAARQMADSLPSLLAMPPKAIAAALSEASAIPAANEVEVKMLEKAKAAAAIQRDAFAKDPIAAANTYLPNKPPAIPMPDPAKPQAFVDALQARLAYSNKMMEDGFTEKPILLSKDEGVALGAMFAKEVPPEIKAMAAQLVVTGLGADAIPFFKQINVSDPTIRMSGQMLAAGGDPVVATDILRGQQMLDEGLVQAPSKANTLAAISPEISSAVDAAAFTTGANMLNVRSDLMASATALAATMLPANASEAQQKQVLTQAYQKVLGQSTATDGETVLGGVQKVAGGPVLLPAGVSGAELNGALERAIGRPAIFATMGAQAPDPAMWGSAGIPSINGEPLSPSLLSRGEVILTPEGGNRYRLSVNRNGTIIDAGVMGNESQPFIFDASALISASREAK